MFDKLIKKIKDLSGKDFKEVTEDIRKYVDEISEFEFREIVKQIGTIPENIGHDSTEEKLYSKASDIVLARCWNASQMMARDKSLSFANAKCCFLPKMDVYVAKKIGLPESKYRNLLNGYKRLIAYRGKTEIAYWTGCIE